MWAKQKKEKKKKIIQKQQPMTSLVHLGPLVQSITSKEDKEMEKKVARMGLPAPGGWPSSPPSPLLSTWSAQQRPFLPAQLPCGQQQDQSTSPPSSRFISLSCYSSLPAWALLHATQLLDLSIFFSVAQLTFFSTKEKKRANYWRKLESRKYFESIIVVELKIIIIKKGKFLFLF